MRSTKAAWFGRRSGGRRRPQGAAAIAADIQARYEAPLKEIFE